MEAVLVRCSKWESGQQMKRSSGCSYVTHIVAMLIKGGLSRDKKLCSESTFTAHA